MSIPIFSQTMIDSSISPLECEAPNRSERHESVFANLRYTAIGIGFGWVLTQAQIISWLRFQDMFRLHDFYMFGVIGTAVVVGAASVWLLKRFGIKTLNGEAIQFPQKRFSKGQLIGGLLFGFGWVLTGACPGPLFAQLGSGYTSAAIALIAAIAGTWSYGALRSRLPH